MMKTRPEYLPYERKTPSGHPGPRDRQRVSDPCGRMAAGLLRGARMGIRFGEVEEMGMCGGLGNKRTAIVHADLLWALRVYVLALHCSLLVVTSAAKAR